MITRPLIALTLLLTLITAACAGSDSTTPDSPTPEPPVSTSSTPAINPSDQHENEDEDVIIRSGTPAFWLGDSLRTMVEAFDTIVVGTITGVRGVVYHQNVDEDGPVGSGIPSTVFDVEVSRVIASPRVQAGDTIAILQAGGPLDGGLIWEPEAPLEVGTTYLFFVGDSMPMFGVDAFGGQPFGRFVVTPQGFIRSTGWAILPAVQEVTGAQPGAAHGGASPRGRTVDDAAAVILAAIAEAPLPTFEERYNPDGDMTFPLPNPYVGSVTILPPTATPGD